MRASTRELGFAAGGPWWCARRGVRRPSGRLPPPPRARRRRARPASPCRRGAAGRGRCGASRSAAPGKVETMISSTRSSWTACIAAAYGSGCAIWPCASMPAPRSSASARRSRRSASGCPLGRRSLCGATIRKLAGTPRRALADRREQRLAEHASRSRPRGRSPRRGLLASGRRRRARPGRPRRPSRIWSTTLRRSQPELLLRVRRDDDLVTGGSSCASASRTASTGSVSTTKPVRPGCPPRGAAPASCRAAARARRPPRVLVDDVALARAR